MKRSLGILSCWLLSSLFAITAQAQSQGPRLISTDERCALNRVDEESLPIALENCIAAAESGDMQAQFEMGEFYYHGEHIKQDLPKALTWYERASVKGHPDAQYRLGLMNQYGEGMPRNLTQAYVILKMASINGQDAAMDASDLLAEKMSDEETAAATQVLGNLFRSYLRHIHEEQLNELNPTQSTERQ